MTRTFAHKHTKAPTAGNPRNLPAICILLTSVYLCLIATPGFGAQADPSQAASDPSLQTAAPTGRIVVKLTPRSGLVMGSQGLQTRPGLDLHDKSRSDTDARRLDRLVAAQVPGGRLETRFPGRSMDKAGPGTDLARYAHLDADGQDRFGLLKLAARLKADPAVEAAFLEPRAVPAALGFDAFTGTYTSPTAVLDKAGPVPAVTPDFEADQGYLGAAPTGVGALPMRAQAGALGTGVTVVDVEGAWLWDHEDLPAPALDLNLHVDDIGWRNHGTAVLGEIRGTDNGFGITGITPDCAVGASAIGNGVSTAQAIVAAADALSSGDLILIELHAPGPLADGNGQYGYLPMEYWLDNFDAIRYATLKGVLVIEAAGNGFQNLDDPVYLDLFDRNVRDSGAIMCGATDNSTLLAAPFSNNGQRVDLNGWGSLVTTTAYGDLQAGAEAEWYTAYFSGTSSASPIVTGSVASLQGMVRARYGFDLDARLARDILRQTGTVMTGGNPIGTRPDLVAAFALADTGVGEVVGTVIEQGTGTPLAGVVVSAVGNGTFTTTNVSGQWRLPLLTGDTDLVFSSFYHQAETATVTVTTGQTTVQDIQLTQLVLINLTGRVGDLDGPLPGAVVTPIDQPVPGTVANALGDYSVDDVPTGHSYSVLFDGVPGHGPRLEVFHTLWTPADMILNPVMPVVNEDFEAGDGGFTPSGGLWAYGYPPASVVGSAFDGILCWGAGMTGVYADNQADTLTSPVYDLSSVTAEDYYLGFHYYCATEPGFDGVNLEVSTGGDFELLVPLSLYTDLTLGGLGNYAGWSGDSGRWTGAVFDISAYTGGDFTFRLNFGSDGGVYEHGFYLDGIAFGQGLVATPVPGDDLPGPALSRLRVWPNPFNPYLTVAYALDKPGDLRVEIFDVRGRRAKTLFTGSVTEARGTLVWDGQLDSGATAPSGVYLVRLQGESGLRDVQRVVLAK